MGSTGEFSGNTVIILEMLSGLQIKMKGAGVQDSVKATIQG